MTFEEATAQQIAIERGNKTPSKQDYKDAKAFQERINKQRIRANLTPYI